MSRIGPHRGTDVHLSSPLTRIRRQVSPQRTPIKEAASPHRDAPRLGSVSAFSSPSSDGLASPLTANAGGYQRVLKVNGKYCRGDTYPSSPPRPKGPDFAKKVTLARSPASGVRVSAQLAEGSEVDGLTAGSNDGPSETRPQEPRVGLTTTVGVEVSPDLATALLQSRAAANKPPGALKIIGLGARGLSALTQLQDVPLCAKAAFWAIDSEQAVLDTAPSAGHVLVRKDRERALLPLLDGDIERIVDGAAARGPDAASAASDFNSGVAFVMAAAGASLAEAQVLYQVVEACKHAGLFIIVVLTRPFAFESAAKRQALADTMVESLRENSHPVVVVEQDLLLRHNPDVSMPQARQIAEQAMVHAVKNLLLAMNCPEIVKISGGAGAPQMERHGRDLRQLSHSVQPPVQHVLSCSGTCALGRGIAAFQLPASRLELDEGNAHLVLHNLAQDAVQAAADGIFLRGTLGRASGALCILKVPSLRKYFRRVDGDAVVVRTPAWRNNEHIAVGEAIAAAARTVVALLAASGCEDIVLAASDDSDVGQGLEASVRDDDTLCMEAVLFVVSRPPDAPAQRAQRAVGAGRAAAPAAAEEAPEAAAAAAPRRVVRPPPSAWGAMSKLAGASARPMGAAVAPAPASEASDDSPAAAPHEAPPRRLWRPPVAPSAAEVAAGVGSGSRDSDVEVEAPAPLEALPPEAARWRALQRASEDSPHESSAGKRGLRTISERASRSKRPSGRSELWERMNNMLQLDRNDTWDQD